MQEPVGLFGVVRAADLPVEPVHQRNWVKVVMELGRPEVSQVGVGVVLVQLIGRIHAPMDKQEQRKTYNVCQNHFLYHQPQIIDT